MLLNLAVIFLKCLIVVLFVSYALVTARLSGGGLGAHKLNKKGAVDDNGVDLGGVAPFDLTWLPELFFAKIFGISGYMLGSLFFGWKVCLAIAIASTAWSYIWMQTGHASFYGMWPRKNYDYKRKNTLSAVVDRLATPNTVKHSWIGMGLKGFLIGVPALPCGLLLCILWPLSYHIGFKMGNEDGETELISGAAAGLVAGILSILIW